MWDKQVFSEIDSMNAQVTWRYDLGLDIGAASVGVSVVRVDEKGEPHDIPLTAVRCFEAGVDGDIEQGRDSSRAVVRRTKRLMRRQLWRRARRRRKVLRLLQMAELFPPGMTRTPEECHNLVVKLDAQLSRKWGTDPVKAHTWPYLIRAAALDQKVERFELGKALYQLAHRRGYQSNRKTDRKQQDTGPVKEGIKQLAEEMSAAGARTVGEFFSKLNPEEKRIRERWTSRLWFKHEFELIIAAQRPFHGDFLTDKFVAALRAAIFMQRPLKSSRDLIGKCALEPGKRRAPLALVVAQRFRMLAAVNNLAIFEPSGLKRCLSREERDKVIAKLETEGDQTFDKLRMLLGPKKGRKAKDKLTVEERFEPGHVFNLEGDGGETKIPGNRTSSKIRPIFSNWDTLSSDKQDDIVLTMVGIESGETLARIARERWGLDPAAAKALAEVELEDDRARFSRVALARLVSRMDDGLPYMTAQKDEYGVGVAKEPVPELPPVMKAVDLRNPAVCRALSEVRKVVNACVKAFGKPRVIRIELATELKKPRKEREAVWKNNRERQKIRDAAELRIIKEAGIQTPTRADKEKFMLADECNWTCPYTGKSITIANLFQSPQFDVEHIIPLSVSLDNGFRNKTLCYHEFNRHVKRNMTPFESCSGDEAKWSEIIARVRRFRDGGHGKLETFLMTPEAVATRYGDFTERHLQDTRYASKLAAEYLGLLYGGVVDAEGKRRIFAVSGGITHELRRQWGLEEVIPSLPDLPTVPADVAPGEKHRFDHRHHALDATVIALTTPAMIKRLADNARHNENLRRVGLAVRYTRIEPPLENCVALLREKLSGVIVSHRCNRKLSGALHAETNYSKAFPGKKPGQTVHRKRKPLMLLSANEVENIVDEKIKALVMAKLGDGKPDKVFADHANHPFLTTHDGRKIPIHNVRITVTDTLKRIGNGVSRFVGSGKDTIHHTVIFEKLGKTERQWEQETVDRITVAQRLSRGEPVVQRIWPTGEKYVMFLCKNDCLELDDDGGVRRIFVVKKFSKTKTNNCVVVRPHNDARLDKQVESSKENTKFILTPNWLRKRNAKKVTIGPLGTITYVRD